MPISIKTDGAFKLVTHPFVRIGDAWKAAVGYVKVDGIWRMGSEQYKITATPSYIYLDVYISGPGFEQVETGNVVITATGGQAPYSYAWTRESGSALISISSTTSNVVHWSAMVGRNSLFESTWKCTVTDAESRVLSISVGVTIAGHDNT